MELRPRARFARGWELRYKNLVHTFKREAVQFFAPKNLAVNHLPLEALPAVQTCHVTCGHVTFCGLPFPMKNLMLKVPIVQFGRGKENLERKYF